MDPAFVAPSCQDRGGQIDQDSRLLPTLPLEGRVAKLGRLALAQLGRGSSGGLQDYPLPSFAKALRARRRYPSLKGEGGEGTE